MGTRLLFFYFFKLVLDQEVQDTIAEIERAVPEGSVLSSVPM